MLFQRFTGNQIAKIYKQKPEAYYKTEVSRHLFLFCSINLKLSSRQRNGHWNKFLNSHKRYKSTMCAPCAFVNPAITLYCKSQWHHYCAAHSLYKRAELWGGTQQAPPTTDSLYDTTGGVDTGPVNPAQEEGRAMSSPAQKQSKVSCRITAQHKKKFIKNRESG